MASSTDHLVQAQGNESFYEDIGADRSSTPEWAMTILFYAALHYAQAALIHLQGTGPGDHKERKQAIRTTFGAIAPDYESLEDASRRARYECERPKRDELQAAQQLVRGIANEIAKTAPPASYA
jgi:hypothetical protein